MNFFLQFRLYKSNCYNCYAKIFRCHAYLVGVAAVAMETTGQVRAGVVLVSAVSRVLAIRRIRRVGISELLQGEEVLQPEKVLQRKELRGRQRGVTVTVVKSTVKVASLGFGLRLGLAFPVMMTAVTAITAVPKESGQLSGSKVIEAAIRSIRISELL